jgi:hypothetical protein
MRFRKLDWAKKGKTMNSSEQAAGERRVRDHLFAPLERLGLNRPSGMAVAKFDDMKSEVSAKLAYMDQGALSALAEQIQCNPAGKDKDRFPSGPLILKWAADISPPADSASPLLRNVFASAIGRQAMQEGWGPELRRWLKKTRQWPKDFMVQRLRGEALEGARRMRQLQERVDRGEVLTSADAAWFAARGAAQVACEEIVELGKVST